MSDPIKIALCLEHVLGPPVPLTNPPIREITPENYARAVSLDPARPLPPLEDLEAVWPDVDAARFAEKRRREYPPLGDQLDAIVKGLQALREGGAKLPEETSAWLDACLAVKSKYPKPE